MAKVTAPLFGLSASGSIGKAIVFGSWRGIDYARQHVIPANPQTAAQTEVRDTFTWLNNLFRFFPALVTESWTAAVTGRPLTPINRLIKDNLTNLTSQADISAISLAPSVASGPVADAMVITPGSLQLSVALTAPTLPTGWTITHGVACCVRDQDPQSGALFGTTAGLDVSDPFAIVLTSLTASVLYQVGGWFKYLKPDGTIAYGPALMDSDTPTA